MSSLRVYIFLNISILFITNYVANSHVKYTDIVVI